jgi:pyridoxal phosphate enzyme (YggS family)
VTSDQLADRVSSNLADIRNRIRKAGGDPGQVTVVGVTKGFGGDVVRAALAAGIRDIGENYAQELLAKQADGDPDTRWHFLGPVQRNKVGRLAPHVHLWQGVDRLAAGEAIARHRPGAGVLVQVNVSGEAAKAGCRMEDAPAVVGALRQLDLEVAGLMAVGPLGPPEAARPGFRRLAQLATELGLRELSMGMSQDLEIAVEEGATMVRIGEALFGPRPKVPRL